MRIITKLQLFVYHLNWLGGQLQMLCTWAFFFEMIQDGNPGRLQHPASDQGGVLCVGKCEARQGQTGEAHEPWSKCAF